MADPITLTNIIGKPPTGTPAGGPTLGQMTTTGVTAEGGGKNTVTLTERIGLAPPAALETIVSPFVPFKERRDQRLEQIRNPPGTVETATLCWGTAPALQQSTTKPPAISDHVVVRGATDKPKSPDDENKEFVFREIERKTKKIKVASEDDPDVFVMVERIETWIANGPNGRYRFEFKNKTK